MSFSSDISNSQNKKIVLVEIDIPYNINQFINYEAGIWFLKFISEDVDVEDDNSNTGKYSANCIIVPDKINSASVNGEFYTKVTSISSCYSTDESFYYDEDENTVYVHFSSFGRPLRGFIYFGIVNGFSTIMDGYYDDTYYDPRVVSIPSIGIKKDILQNGIMQFQSGDITFINTDGYFDNFHDLNIYSQPVRILLGVEGYDYDDFEKMAEGYIDDYSYDFNEFKIKYYDKRKNLTRKIPYNQFTQDEYPYLSDDDVGEYKPLVWGLGYLYKVICINATETSPTYRTYMFLDTEKQYADSINSYYATAYVAAEDNKDSLIEITIQNIDIYYGTFDVTASDVEDDEGELKEVFFSGFGFETTSTGITAIENIFDNYTIEPYTALFFDTVEITSEMADSREIGIVLQKPTEIKKIIEDICVAEDAIFYVTNEGKYSMKKYDTSRSSSMYIDNFRFIDDPRISYSTGNFLTSCAVSGLYDFFKKKYTITIDNRDYESVNFSLYKKYEEKTYNTILIDEDEIQDKTEIVLAQANKIFMIVNRKTDLSCYDVNIMDIVTMETSRQTDETNISDGYYEVIDKTYNFNDFTIDWKFRKL